MGSQVCGHHFVSRQRARKWGVVGNGAVWGMPIGSLLPSVGVNKKKSKKDWAVGGWAALKARREGINSAFEFGGVYGLDGRLGRRRKVVLR